MTVNVISRPNNWAETLSIAARQIEDQELSETNQLYQEYWLSFAEFMSRQTLPFSSTKAHPQAWMSMSFCRGVELNAAVSIREKYFRIAAVFRGSRRRLIDFLKEEDQSIRTELGQDLSFYATTKGYYIRSQLDDQSIEDKNTWLVQHQWLCDAMRRFQQVLLPRIERLRSTTGETDSASSSDDESDPLGLPA